MRHLEPDLLVLVALGEPMDESSDDGAADHLHGCAECRAEVATLRAVATLGRQTQEVRDLPDPPPAVWNRIAAEVGLPAPTPIAAARVRRRPRWLTPALAAVAAAVVAVVGTIVTIDVFRPKPTPPPRVTAQVTLDPLREAPAGSAGYVRLLAGGRLHVHVDVAVPAGEDLEVWLIDRSSIGDAGGLRMKAIGYMAGRSDQTFPIDPAWDLSRYSVVDLSAEPDDGNSAHSGRSLLRATLPG